MRTGNSPTEYAYIWKQSAPTWSLCAPATDGRRFATVAAITLWRLAGGIVGVVPRDRLGQHQQRDVVLQRQRPVVLVVDHILVTQDNVASCVLSVSSVEKNCAYTKLYAQNDLKRDHCNQCEFCSLSSIVSCLFNILITPIVSFIVTLVTSLSKKLLTSHFFILCYLLRCDKNVSGFVFHVFFCR